MSGETTERLAAIRGRLRNTRKAGEVRLSFDSDEGSVCVARLVEHAPDDLRWLLAEHDRLTVEVDRLTVNATAREGVMRREGDALRSSQREVERLRSSLSRCRIAAVALNGAADIESHVALGPSRFALDVRSWALEIEDAAKDATP